ncbi:gliding motility-associated C-terminal domain-containing protein [Chitinophaga sp. Hz27]|uniref:T9SS type B sorting domain-containing protein n=1 Tax=Chitinophaga sp. Hz27 TaxID=3347169 RepID=UPI0035DF76B7
MTKKTFLAIKYWLTAILLLCCICGLRAQSGNYKNTTGVSGDASLGAVSVSDISFANYQFPMLGMALSATTPAIQSDGSYNITYTYTLKNYGGIPLTQVQVNSDLATTFASPMTFTVSTITATGITSNSAFTGSGANKQLLAAGATLAPGASATVTVVINLKNNGQYGTFNTQPTATATAGTGTVTDLSVNGANPDANGNGVPMDDQSPTPVTIARPDIEVTKTIASLTPFVGDNIVFTITVVNRGAGDAVNVKITEQPDNGFTLVTATPSTGSYNAATKIWTISQLNAGASATLSYTMTVNATGPYSNTASSNHPEDNIPGNNSDTKTLTPKPSADVQIVKTVDNLNPDVLSTVTYTLTAKNAGPSDAANVVVTDKIPTGIEPVAPLPSGMTYNAATRTFTWNLGTMVSGATQSNTIQTQVQADIDRSNFTNTATITTTDHDPTPANNTSSVTIIPKEAVDLQVTKDVITTTNPIYPLDPVSFVIKVKNLGPNNCYDANVTDLLGSGYSFVSATPSQGTYTSGTGLWKIGTVLKDQEVTLTIKATITAKVNYGNTATISTTDNDNNPANNTASITPPPVKPRTDLQVTITPTGTQEVGNNISFAIVVKNNGPSDATTVVLDNVLLPAGYTFFSKNQAGYDNSSGIWSIGNLAAGSSVTLTLVGTLLPDAGNYDVNAHVSGKEDEVTLTNNIATTTMAVKQVADLAVTKTVDNTAPEVGQAVNFTITVTNNGPSIAHNVVVTEAKPNGYTFNLSTPSQGSYTGSTWTVGTLAKGASATLTINATVLPNGNYTNTASAATTDKDNNTANNSATVTPTVTQLADLSVTKTINNPNPDAGSNVQFTLVATNNGPSTATSVHVLDLLPNGYTFVSASPAGQYNYVNGQWTIGNLNNGQSATLTISATVRPTGYYKNTAAVAGAQKDPNITNNNAFVDPTIRPVADLQITKTVSSATPDQGTDVVYHLVAQNLGVSDASNVVVTDLLPAGVTYKPTAASAAYDKNSGTWNIGMLGAGTSTSIDITVTVNPNTGLGTISNIATIAGTEYDPIMSNNSSSVAISPVTVADLEIVKTVDDPTPNTGAQVTFTLTAKNLGVSNATGVTVTDVLPNGYTLVNATPSTGSIAGNTWNIGNLNANTTATATIKALVNASGNYQNTAIIIGSQPDRNTSNNTSSITPVPVPVANLNVTKTISNATPDAGSQVTFTITATNAGSSNANGVTVTDILQSGYSIVSATPAVGTYNSGTGVWAIGNMTSGQTTTLTITANVLPTGNYNNSASISSPVKDTDPTDNTATITPPVVRAVTDLSIVKTVNNSTTDAGTPVTFTLVAGNNGPSTATNVVVSDLLPSGYTFVSASPAAAYDAASGKWTIGTLNTGASQTITITATVNPEGNYTNTATIGGQEYDPNTTNNTSSVTVTRIPVADLEVIKSADKMTPDAGANVTFTIQALNHGASKATGVTVTDILQSGYAFVSATPAAGTYNTATGIWTIGDLEKDATTTLTITAKVLATGNYSNSASINGNEIDRIPSNNTSGVILVPVPVANLNVTKTISNATPDAGSQVTFTITATNAGPSNATAVTVTDILQSGYAFVSATPAVGTYNNTTGVWTIGNMTNGQTTTLTITAKVLPTGDYSNSAIISSPVKDTDPTDNTASITPPVVRAVTDLSIVKTVNNSTTDAGTPVTFTLVAGNNGPSTATNVVVSDLLPSGYTFASANPAAAYDAASGKWTIGTLNTGASQTITITATVNPEGNYTNTATIGGQEYDPNTTNNTSSVTVTRIPVADLEVIKSADKMTPDAGANVTFTIQALNHGASKATGVTVTDILQSGYSFVSATPAAGTYNTATGVWAIGDLEKDATTTLTITAKVLATGNYSNSASINGNEIDRIPSNNTSGVILVPVPVANLNVTKTISNATPDAGSQVTFTITATNAGPSNATAVTVTDILQSGYAFVSATPAVGTYNNTTGVWAIGNMTNGQTTTLTITAKVLPTGDYSNSAIISSPVKDTDPTDNTASITPPVVRAVTDLSIVKTVNNSTTDAGTPVTFTLVAGNNGPSTATNVVVSDLLPSGYTFVSANPAAVYDAASGKWTIGTLNTSASQTITITATVNAEGIYTNTATISGQEFDPNTTNNTSSVTVTRIPVADLEVIKSVDNNNPDVGTNVTFTIQALNHGVSKATGVTVTDILQSGYAFVSATPAAGTYNTATGVWTIGDLEKDATTTLTITAKVLATGNYSNSASISGNEADRVSTNNNSSVTPVPVPVANLNVTKTISNATPDAGSQVTFTITATNAGPSNATAVTVTDILQSGYAFVSAAPAIGTYNATTGVWTIGKLNNGQQTTLTITATVLPTGDYSNTATIKGNEKDKTPTDDASSIVPPVPVPVADLQVIKTISNTVPGTGDIVSFQVVVKNNGPSTATNATVTDVMQNGFSYQQSTTSKGNFNSNTGVWTIGTLTAGETATLQVDAWVNTTGIYINTATVKADEKDPDNSNNSSVVNIKPDPITDLHVSKSVSNMAPPHGSDVTFTIIAGNDGPSDGTGITVTDVLPAGYSFKSASATTGSYSATTGIWNIGNMTKNATATLTVTATVNKTGNYTNTAVIKGNETDRNQTNNTSAVTPVPVPLHTNDDAASTEEPDPVTINVIKNDVYGNTGHTVFIKDKPLHGTVTDNGDGTVTYTPEAGFGGTDYFTYYIQDQSGFASNVSTVTIDVTKRLVDLSIKKVIVTPPAEIAVGKNVTFELTVTNNSRKGASGVVVTDILANNVGDTEIKTETQNGQEGYDPVTKTMSWKIDTLAPGQTVKLLVTAKLLSGGQVNNTATVAGKNADPDPDNNTATVSTPVKGADIFVPTAFTPNGDGINDKFVILGIDRYPNSQLIIWNRWGNVVYRSNDYRNGWDGSGLNEGTYYYELNCPSNDGKITLKGWLQLVR